MVEAFDLKQESDEVRRRYGVDPFGQGCLMARRLVERGVPVVEVSLSDGPGGLSWDSHQDNFTIVKRLSERLDRGWSQLIGLEGERLVGNDHDRLAWRVLDARRRLIRRGTGSLPQCMELRDGWWWNRRRFDRWQDQR